MTSPDKDAASGRSGRPWQYSMTTLLLVTAGTAMALAVLVSFPSTIAVPVLICLTIAIPAVLCVVAIYGSGYQRTFCIGALFPTGIMLYTTGWLMGLSLFEPPSTSDLKTLEEWLAFLDDVSVPYRLYVGSAWLSMRSMPLVSNFRLRAEQTIPPSQGPQLMETTLQSGRWMDSFWAILFNTSLAMA